MFNSFKKIKNQNHKDSDNFLEGVGFPLSENKKGRIQGKVFRMIFVSMASFVIIGLGALLLLENSQPDTTTLIKKVSEIMILPQEEPIIVRVTSYELASSIPFYKESKEGDVILLFKKARKAILYSPKLDKVLNTGFIEEAGISTQ